jgi:proline iminopeptidase
MSGPPEFVSTGTLRDYDWVQQLRDLKLPTLCVVGEYDEVPVATAREFQARVADSIVRVVPGSGHDVRQDQTQVFNEIIAAFLKEEENR